VSYFAPLFFVLLIGILLIQFAMAGLERAERHRLQIVIYSAFFVRIALATLLEAFPQFRLFHDDAGGYELNAISMALSWQGLGPPVELIYGGVFNHGYLYVGAALCYLFGLYPLHLPLWNGLFGALAIVILYRLARNLFHQAVAFRATLFLAFMPSMIVWSSVAIKDPLMILLITLALYLYILVRQRLSIPLLALLCAVVLATFLVRFYIAYFLLLAILGTALVGRSGEGFSRLRNLVVVGALAIAIGASGLSDSLNQGLAESTNLEQAAQYRVGMAETARSGFAHDVDISSPGGMAVVLPIGLAVILFGPFPWQMRGLLPLLTLPEMLLWWSLVPALWRGLRFAASRSFARSAPVFVFCGALSIAYALTLGNVGAAVRQRSQIFVFLFLLVALGQYVRHCRHHGIDPMLLIRPPGGYPGGA
jgi:4-amino-4-deoxy-L-arabinose transferase-like glycosyltransferase